MSWLWQWHVWPAAATALPHPKADPGQLPLGHAGIMAVGAYAGALFWKAVPGLPTPVAIFCGILVAGLAASLFGVIIGVPALRLKGDYLAIITLGFGEIIRIAIINLPDITGGTPGLLNIPKYSNFTVIFLCLAVCCFVVHNLMPPRHGRAILVEQVFDIIRELHEAGTTILLVEQNAQMALSIADRAYVLETGKISLSGTGRELAESESVRKAYLGG